MAIRPFANAPHADKNSIATNWLIGVQTGNTPNAVNQMKYLTVDEFTAYVRSTYGSMWNYRGDFSSATPTDPEVNDYFVCTGNFTEDGQSFVSGHVYAYNGNTWGDVSNVFLQYVKQSDFETLSDDVDAIDDRLTEAEQRIDAMTGMVFKGDTTRANLPTASASNQGWVYYLTDESIYVASNGTQWVTVMNYVVQTITEGDTTHAPSADAVYNKFFDTEEKIKNTSMWESDHENEVTFSGDLAATWADMEREIPVEPNDGIFLCEADEAPSSSQSSGIKGQFFADDDWFYICIADNTWRRVALTTF